jgi:3alpha(or 20beta)-hydroxysteroid dehydrogenase
MGRLDGKVALISGAARGQGAATAARIVAEGARVVLGDVLDDEGKRLADELGAAAEYVHLDVREELDWENGVRAAGDGFGRLDVLVNNAGVVAIGGVDEQAPDDFMAVVAVNQLGVFLGMRAAVPLLKSLGGGSIVNVSSIEGLIGAPLMGAYCASKFAVIGLTKAAAIELGPSGIRVNAVCPGVVRTAMTSKLPERVAQSLIERTPLRRFGEADEIVSLNLYLAGDESSFCTGAAFTADGGMTAGL